MHKRDLGDEVARRWSKDRFRDDINQRTPFPAFLSTLPLVLGPKILNTSIASNISLNLVLLYNRRTSPYVNATTIDLAS